MLNGNLEFMMLKRFPILLTICFFIFLFKPIVAAQSLPFFEIRTDIPAKKNNILLKHAWAGGFNNPQFSAADLNNNGIDDLVIFDRTGGKVLTFLNDGIADSISYTYAPEFEQNFPSDMMHWMLMRDMSCNGIPDILTSQVAAVKVLRGYYDENDMLAFEEWGFMQYLDESGNLQFVFVTQIDIPGFADINADGDIDILTFNQLGGFIQYFENLSVEKGLCGDTLLFELRDDCWGNVFESEFADTAQFLDTCGTLIPNPQQAKGFRHPGSTLLPFDATSNGVKDLLLGDILFTKVNLLINGGTPDSAKIVKQDAEFPVYDEPINLPMFPAAFKADVNNNGKNDILIAPNALQISENINCAWLYENVTTDDTARFSLSTKGFLVDEMIDVGEGAVPIPFDYTGNGVKDLIIANYGKFIEVGNLKSTPEVWENVGTNENPELVFLKEDFAQLSLLTNNQLHPSFGDLTGNGVKDMIVGDRFGNIHFFQNTAASGQTANFVLSQPNLININGSFAAPFLYDINGNGLLDLIVGERNGNVKYYENKGTKQQFEFSPPATNNQLGMMDARVPGVFTGFAIPWVMASGGKEYVLLGTSHGSIKVYQLDKNKLESGSFSLITENYSGIHVGSRSAPAILGSESNKHLVVGNYRGGLNFYTASDSTVQQTDEVLASHKKHLKIYPNPVKDELNIEFKTNDIEDFVVKLYDITGRLVFQKSVYQKNKIKIATTNLKSGNYVLKLVADKHILTERLIKIE